MKHSVFGGTMFLFRIFLCASIFIAASFAYIPNENAKFSIFDFKLQPFERKLSEHINDFETKFKNVKDEGPLLAPIGDALNNIEKMLDGDWKASFLEAVNADGGSSDTAVKSVAKVKQLVEKLNKNFLMYQMNKAERRSRGPKIVSELADILQKFNAEDSVFRKYPLISSPLLIELALVAALFDPITKALGIESEITKDRLPCLAYDLLFEYREYAVDSRLDKLQVEMVRGDEKHKVGLEDLEGIATQDKEHTLLATPYKPSIALSERAETIGDTYKEGYFNDDEFKFNDCQNPKHYTDTFNVIVDDFGEDNAKQWHLPTCAGEYATIVKTRTEKMYPVSFFKDICNEAEGNPSGKGYLTFKIKRIQAHQPYEAQECDFNFWTVSNFWLWYKMRCDPYIELTVGKDKVWTSTHVDNTALITPNYVYKSKNPIEKDTEVVIKVWDKNSGDPALVQSTGGKISDWLTKRNRPGRTVSPFQNLIETFVMWKDVYTKN